MARLQLKNRGAGAGAVWLPIIVFAAVLLFYSSDNVDLTATVTVPSASCSTSADCPDTVNYQGATLANGFCTSQGQCTYRTCLESCTDEICNWADCPNRDPGGCGNGLCEESWGETPDTCTSDCGASCSSLDEYCQADFGESGFPACCEASPYCVNQKCQWTDPAREDEPGGLDARWLKVQVDKEKVYVQEAVEVIGTIQINRAGNYFLEAGIHGAGTSNLASIYRNSCNPTERWYSSETKYYNRGTYEVRFKVWPARTGVYEGEPHVYWSHDCSDGFDPDRVLKYPRSLSVEPRPSELSTSTTILPGRDCTGQNMDAHCVGNTLHHSAKCLDGIVEFESYDCPGICVESGALSMCRDDPCRNMDCDDGDPNTFDTCERGQCINRAVGEYGGGGWQEYKSKIILALVIAALVILYVANAGGKK